MHLEPRHDGAPPAPGLRNAIVPGTFRVRLHLRGFPRDLRRREGGHQPDVAILLLPSLRVPIWTSMDKHRREEPTLSIRRDTNQPHSG